MKQINIKMVACACYAVACIQWIHSLYLKLKHECILWQANQNYNYNLTLKYRCYCARKLYINNRYPVKYAVISNLLSDMIRQKTRSGCISTHKLLYKCKIISLILRSGYEQEALAADMIIKAKTKLWPEASDAQ